MTHKNGETFNHADGITLKEFFNTKINALEEKIELNLKLNQVALDKADIKNDAKLACVAMDTPILCSDLIWRPAGDLREGDELISLDEKITGKDFSKRGRRFRRTIVISNSLAQDYLLRVNTTMGSVSCNKEHPWLVLVPHRQTSGKYFKDTWEWRNTADLRVGDMVKYIVKPWVVDMSWEAGWLAGMFDGEGCLSIKKDGSVQLTIVQKESETAELIGTIWREKSYGDYVGKHNKKLIIGNQPLVYFLQGCRRSVLRTIGSIRPPRLLSKSDTVWENRPISGRENSAIVTSIEDLGKGVIAVLSTSTKTYIANGFAMHNSMNEFRDALKDQASGFISRIEADLMIKGMEARVKGLELKEAEMKGKATAGSVIIAYLIATISIIIGIINLIK